MVNQTLDKKKTLKKSQKKLLRSNNSSESVSSSPLPTFPVSPRDSSRKVNKKNEEKKERTEEEIFEERPQQNQIKKIKKTSKQIVKNSAKKSSNEPRMNPEMLERLRSVINLEEIEANGFSQDLWRSLSFEEKTNLPIFISLQFRNSSTSEERKKNQKRKQILNGIMLRYQKLAIHQFYLANKKKIKLLREENSISGNKATEMLWNTLSSEEKNDWYHQSTLEVVEGKQESEEEKEDECDVVS